ncbi:MAG TPA: tetratricopeptide repeat protein [Desulfocapsa sulfexigens]|nr:tetratricopeptide repeat protein [Desulfocapsa sulfexigens]
MSVSKSICRIFISFLVISLLQATVITRSMAFTVGEEREVGEQLLYQIRLAFPLLDDPDISQYINDLGNNVIEVAGIQYFDYRFNIVESSQFNAFAAPSGLVFFFTGLIEQMNNEDELVSVLAHEIGHVAARHIAEGMETGSKVTIATTLLAVAGLALGAGAISQALFAGSLAAGQAANLHFSRQHEEEADLIAYGWMKKMKRHPKGQESMLRTMRRISRYTMGHNVPQYLLTHPHPEYRLDYVQSLIAFEGDQLADYKPTDNFAFLRFKYRILSLVKDGKNLRNLLQNHLNDSCRSESDKIMLHYGMSQLDRMENNYEASKKHLQKVISYYPDQSILLVDLGMIEMAAGNNDYALSLITDAYNRNRNDMWATFQLARIWLQLGNINKAERYLKEVQSNMPDYSKVYFEIGKLKAAKGEKGNSLYYLGKYNLYEGRLKIARDNLRIALKDPAIDKDLKADIKKIKELMDKLEEKN